MLHKKNATFRPEKRSIKVMRPDQSDSELIRRVLSGEKAAFRRIVENNQRLVRHIVFRLIPDPDDREDLCQEVFLQVYEHLHRFEGKSRLSTWIGRIAYNTCLHFLEKKRPARYADIFGDDAVIDSEPARTVSPAEVTASRLRATNLCEQIDALPVRYGLILTLYHFNEMTYDEIARLLDMPSGTVKNYLFRARRMLRQRLERLGLQEEICA